MKYLSVKWLEACWMLLCVRVVDYTLDGPSSRPTAMISAAVMFVVSLAGFGVAYLVKRSR